jgi:hypothetical protein
MPSGFTSNNRVSDDQALDRDGDGIVTSDEATGADLNVAVRTQSGQGLAGWDEPPIKTIDMEQFRGVARSNEPLQLFSNPKIISLPKDLSEPGTQESAPLFSDKEMVVTAPKNTRAAGIEQTSIDLRDAAISGSEGYLELHAKVIASIASKKVSLDAFIAAAAAEEAIAGSEGHLNSQGKVIAAPQKGSLYAFKAAAKGALANAA